MSTIILFNLYSDLSASNIIAKGVVVQLGIATIPLCILRLSEFISGITRGTSSFNLNSELSSIIITLCSFDFSAAILLTSEDAELNTKSNPE